MDGLQRRTRQLELPTRLQGNVAALFGERDDLAILLNRLPTKAACQPLQDCADTIGAVVGNMLQTVACESKLLVFSSEPPLIARL